MARTARSFRFHDDVDAALDAVESATDHIASLVRLGQPPDYLRALVERAELQFGTAFAMLRAAGWQRAEMLAACDVLNGYASMEDLHPGQPATWISVELADAARLNETHLKWDVEEQRWGELCRGVAGSEALARAVSIVVREFWAGAPFAAARLEGT